ncbi:hypothetical protein FIU86_15610 [Roseovarius sp. THAF9]|uniref:hypothetical protein n=1 Tax=Roseovarius sp. THAF9 TaxID=2587847 RepID=UPI001268757B|nr:hypothetical protein [Roseovarius sp. THAF9]QFT94276.1 hypothetical protein FIU86_15610 [Roseovarius sp. THAF9]
MRRIIAFSATAILLSSAAMADDSVADSKPEQLELNAAGFLFDDSIREDGQPDSDGDEAADDEDRGNDENTSDDQGQETEDEEDDD